MKNKGSRSLLVIGLTSAIVVVALGAYTKFAPANLVPTDEHRNQRTTEETKITEPKIEVKSNQHKAEGTDVAVFLPKFDKGNNLTFERTMARAPRGEDLREFAVKNFLETTKIADPATRLLSISVKDGLATLSFNAALNSGFGSDDERTFVEGIRLILGQFKEIERLEFFADGVKLDSLGHFEIDNVTVKR